MLFKQRWIHAVAVHTSAFHWSLPDHFGPQSKFHCCKPMIIFIMDIICQALLLLATTSVAFSELPSEYNCAWEVGDCTDGRIYMWIQCACDCPGWILCCDPSILEEYDYPTWQGTAPICAASCRICGRDSSLCWWKSRCGIGRRCWAGHKYLCTVRKRRNFFPFLDKAVSSLLY